MIRYFRHTEIDKTKWDKCISASPAGIAYASSWYLDLVSPGWEALIEDDYVSVFPLTSRKKYGFNYLFQPFFTQQSGLFTQNELVHEENVKQFLENIPSKFKLIEINLNSSNKIDSFSDFKISKRRTHHLSLNNSVEEMRKNYSDNLKRNLKKAKLAIQKIESGNELRAITEIFRLERGADIAQLGDKEYDLLEKIVQQAYFRKEIEILYTRNQAGEVTAGAVFLYSYSSYIFLFSATSKEARESGSMSLIIDHFIEKHQSQDKVLDFEGSMNDDLSRYYRSYGSQEIVYLQIIRNTLPIPFRWFK